MSSVGPASPTNSHHQLRMARRVAKINFPSISKPPEKKRKDKKSPFFFFLTILILTLIKKNNIDILQEASWRIIVGLSYCRIVVCRVVCRVLYVVCLKKKRKRKEREIAAPSSSKTENWPYLILQLELTILNPELVVEVLLLSCSCCLLPIPTTVKKPKKDKIWRLVFFFFCKIWFFCKTMNEHRPYLLFTLTRILEQTTDERAWVLEYKPDSSPPKKREKTPFFSAQDAPRGGGLEFASHCLWINEGTDSYQNLDERSFVTKTRAMEIRMATEGEVNFIPNS